MTDYRFHSDPGHGWLEVPVKELEDLGVQPSRYSYTDGTRAYLEEDCDMPAFLRALDAAGRAHRIIDLRPLDGDHPIRRLRPC